MPIRRQFILSHVLPFALILPLVGVLLLYLIEAQLLLTELGDDLEERAALIAEAASEQPEIWTDAAAARGFIADFGRLTDATVYLADAEGHLLVSEPRLGTPDEELMERAAENTSPVQVNVAYELGEPTGEVAARVVDVNEQLLGIVGVRESIAGVAASFGRLRRLMMLVILGGMALGGLTGYWLARRLEQPIARTVAAVDAVAVGRAEALPSEGPAELRHLSVSVNALAGRLRALEDMRRRSFANIVHELGRPLGAINAAIHVLRGPSGEDAAIRTELLTGVEKELKTMQPLLDDLSLLHADATGRRDLDRQPLALGPWLAAAVQPWHAAAAAKGLTWREDIPAGLPTADIDPVRMTQVVGNLLSNAVKYSPAGGEVALSAAATGGEVRITVSDTGPGIAAEEQALVFQPFYRGRSPHRFTEGLGVGLAIARSLTEAHGGRLTLDSAPGRGSAFTLHLPLDEPAPAARH